MAVSSPGHSSGGTATGHRKRLWWGIAIGACALVLFGGFTALDMVPSRGRQGQRLLLYFLMDLDGWKFILFVLGGLCLSVALPCLVPPPVSKIRFTWLRRGLKVLLGLLFVMTLACWSLFSLLLLLMASRWSYSAYSDTEGHRVLVRWQSYGVEIWTLCRAVVRGVSACVVDRYGSDNRGELLSRSWRPGPGPELWTGLDHDPRDDPVVGIGGSACRGSSCGHV